MITTTLSIACIATDKSITVADASIFPPDYDFVLSIQKEKLLVTGITGNVLTVVRGHEGTEGAAYGIGEPARLVVTEELIQNIYLNDGLLWSLVLGG